MPSGRPRLAGLAAVVVGAVLLTACTADAGPVTASKAVTASVATSGTAPSRSGSPTAYAISPLPSVTVPTADLTAQLGGSVMTPIPEASGCTVRRDLGDRGPVRADLLWPGAGERGVEALEVRTRDGAAGCSGTLPGSPDCDLSLPWAGMDAEELARATRAQRVVTGRAYARVAAASDLSSGTLSLTYAALTFGAARDRLGVASEWFARAVERCGLGGPGSVGAVSGIVGERHKPTLGPGYAGHFLVTVQGTQLVALVLEGGAWSASSRADTVRRVVPMLTGAR